MAYRSGMTFGYNLTPWVKKLLIANAAVFVLTEVVPGLGITLAFTPAAVLLQPWTVITYMFVHGGLWHLFFNMLGLFFFGPPLEERWGSREFIKYYLLCGLGGAVLSFFFAYTSSVVGASGAVYGIMLAFAMIWPTVPIYIWGIFPVQARYLVGIFAVLSIWSAFGGGGDGIAHFAHLGGFAFGYLYLKLSDPGLGPMARLRKTMGKRKLSVVPGGAERRKEPVPSATAVPRQRQQDDGQLLDELDRVLDKISTQGMASLTSEERRLLDDVSRRYRQD